MDLLTALVLAAVLVVLAAVSVRMGALDVTGAAASAVMGMLIGWFGGIAWIGVLLTFTALGFLVTRLGRKQKLMQGTMEGFDGRRGLSNVLGNGGAALLAAFAALIVGPEAAAWAFATAVASVAADTFASEIGTFAPKPRMILPPFAPVRPGTDGAVSWRGQGAAIAGASLIAVASAWWLPLSWKWAWVPAVVGWLGCQLDSVLGATLEKRHDRIGVLSKADVNFVSSAVPAFVVLVATALVL